MTMADDEDAAAKSAQQAPSDPARSNPGDDAAPKSTGGDIHTYIGARLRQAFDDIASQPVPDRFLQLMQDLDKA